MPPNKGADHKHRGLVGNLCLCSCLRQLRSPCSLPTLLPSGSSFSAIPWAKSPCRCGQPTQSFRLFGRCAQQSCCSICSAPKSGGRFAPSLWFGPPAAPGEPASTAPWNATANRTLGCLCSKPSTPPKPSRCLLFVLTCCGCTPLARSNAYCHSLWRTKNLIHCCLKTGRVGLRPINRDGTGLT